MIKILFALMLVVFISGCSSEEISEENSEILNASEEGDFQDESGTPVSNMNSLVTTCSDLCQLDKEDYCIEERTLMFEDGSKTIGSCRALSKFNEEFTKCQGYCTEYGKGPKCMLESGVEDPECDGK